MSEWKEVKLGDLIEVKYGKDHKKLGDGTIPIYGSGGIMRTGDLSLYDQPSVLIPRKGTLSNIFYVDTPFWTVDTMFWTKINTDVVLPKFLYYSIKDYKWDSLNVGSAVPSLTVPVIEDVSINLPPLDIQKKIAAQLSEIDDKIAVNKKICENLEAQAQALFKHWFVDFVPFKDGKFVESELGMIPLSIICEQITDGVHNSVKDEPNSSYMLLSCKNIVGGVLSKNNYRSISKNTFDSLRLRTKLAKGDILISSVGTIGEIAIVEEDPLNYEFQRSVAIVKPKEKIGTYFLYNALLASKTRLQHAAHGAVQQCLF